MVPVICIFFIHIGALAAYGSLISDSYPTRVYGVNCTGSEEELFKCPIHLTPQDVSYEQCAQNDAGVVCQGGTTELYYVYFTIQLYSYINSTF